MTKVVMVHLRLARHHRSMAMGLVLDAELLQLGEHSCLIHGSVCNEQYRIGRCAPGLLS